MRYLILSDLHSNLEALQSVLSHAAGDYDRIVCCGDLAGYGPDPNAIIDWARASLYAVIRGNHDRACGGLDDLEWFNPIARTATLWTIQQLTEENLKYLRALPEGPLNVDGFSLAHGSPLDEDEYVITAQDALNQFPYVQSDLVFFGHTHLQGGFARTGERMEVHAHPCGAENHRFLHLMPDTAYLLNPGSVGQPRDADCRAGYILYDSEQRLVVFHRVGYDDEFTREKIIRAGLPDSLGNRLLVGR